MKLEELKPAYYSFFFFIIILLTGVLGFALIEGYPFVDAFFMTIITVTTVGFGILHPLSPLGKIFTSFLILFSFGFFAFSATTITRYIVSGVFRNYFKYSKVKKEIDKLNNHVIVVGYGRNGSQAIEELKFHNIPIVVIENRESKIKEIQQKKDLLYIEDDPSSDEVLIGAGILRAQALISVLPTDEENLFAVLTSKALNPKLKIISRAINPNTIKKLKTAGASHVIMPDKISGQHMANMIAQPNVIEFMDYLMLEKSKGVILDEVSCKDIPGNSSPTIQQLHSICEENLNIIGLKRVDGRYLVNPSLDIQITNADHLFVLGKPNAIELFRKAICEKIPV
jgi:voltage-gated potassium channel